MQISRKMLNYNISVIVIALIVFAFSYPSEIANYALLLAVIGIFITVDKIISRQNKKMVTAGMLLFFAITFIIIMFYML